MPLLSAALPLAWLRVLCDIRCHCLAVTIWVYATAIMILITMLFFFIFISIHSIRYLRMCSSLLCPCSRHRPATKLESISIQITMSFQQHTQRKRSTFRPLHFGHYQMVFTFYTLFHTLGPVHRIVHCFGLLAAPLTKKCCVDTAACMRWPDSEKSHRPNAIHLHINDN